MQAKKFVAYQTSPKAPIPTGCKSVYLEEKGQSSVRISHAAPRRVGRVERECIPAGDLKGGAEDLGTYELRHDVGLFRVSSFFRFTGRE